MARKIIDSNNGQHWSRNTSSANPYQPFWQPAMDIYRCPGEWIVKVDLAGVDREDIMINLQDNRLSISGQRRDLQVSQEHQTYSMEISYNRFARTIELPVNCADSKVHSEYHDGMLYIHIVRIGAIE